LACAPTIDRRRHGGDPDHEADEATLRFDPWAAWAVVSVGDGRFSVELRRTPFDTEAVAAAHRTSGMPYAEEYARRWSTG